MGRGRQGANEDYKYGMYKTHLSSFQLQVGHWGI